MSGIVRPFATISGAGKIEVSAIDEQSSSLLGRVEVALDPDNQEGSYSFANIPTDTRLLLRTTSVASQSSWATAHRHVVATTAAPTCNEMNDDDCFEEKSSNYRVGLFAVSTRDYVDVPSQAGLVGSIPGANSMIGELRDCGNIRVKNTAVALLPSPSRLAYYSGSVVPIPDSSRFTTGTGPLGLFGAFDALPSGRETTTEDDDLIVVQAVGVLASNETFSDFGRDTFKPVPNSFNFVVIRP